MNTLPPPLLLPLLGLANAADSGRTESEIKKALGKELRPLYASAGAPLEETLRSLAEMGLIEEVARGPGTRTRRWRLLPPGSDALAAHVGPNVALKGRGAIPRTGKLLAVAQTLGVPPAAASAALRKRSALLACLLARQLGEPSDETTTLDTLAGTIAARALGAINTQTATLRAALLRRSLQGNGAEIPNPSGARVVALLERETRPAASSRAFSRDFPAAVLRAARTAPAEAWFGPRKLFIHRAWDAWRAETGDTATDLPAFKTRLLAALRAGELGLASADFIATLNPRDLAAAELRDGLETFHFLTAERASQS